MKIRNVNSGWSSTFITRDIQNNFVELNVTRDETVDTRVKHFPEQPSSPDGNHTITLEQRVKMQYCQKLIKFHHIRLYLDLNLCNEDLLAKICKNVKILCTTPPMATTGTVTHTTLTFLQTCKNVKVVCVTPFIGSKNVKVWHYINFARM